MKAMMMALASGKGAQEPRDKRLGWSSDIGSPGVCVSHWRQSWGEEEAAEKLAVECVKVDRL